MFGTILESKEITVISPISGNIIDKRDYGMIERLFCDNEDRAKGDNEDRAKGDNEDRAKGDNEDRAKGDNEDRAKGDNEERAKGDNEDRAKGDNEDRAKGDNTLRIIYSVKIECKFDHIIHSGYDSPHYRSTHKYDYMLKNSIPDLYHINEIVNEIKNVPDKSIIYGFYGSYGSLIPEHIPKNILNYCPSSIIFEKKYIIYRDLFYYYLSIRKINFASILNNYQYILELYNKDIRIIIEILKNYFAVSKENKNKNKVSSS